MVTAHLDALSSGLEPDTLEDDNNKHVSLSQPVCILPEQVAERKLVEGSPMTEGTTDRHDLPEWLSLELCCGCARLTRELTKIGLKALGIDWVRNNSRPVGPSIKLDLTSKHGQQVVHKALDSGKVKFISAAPPCGTSSRARDRPIASKLRLKGVPSPKPLRSLQWPEGLPELQGVDLERVLAANKLYEFIASVLTKAHSMGILLVVENPHRSYMWATKWFVAFCELEGLISVVYAHCMQGGDDDARKKLVANFNSLKRLAVLCDGKHSHKPYGAKHDGNRWVFGTEATAEYPLLLCQNIARAVAEELQLRGIPLREAASKTDTLEVSLPKYLALAAAGKQSRGHKSPKLLPVSFCRYACQLRSYMSLWIPRPSPSMTCR
jgi:hypothetical protein